MVVTVSYLVHYDKCDKSHCKLRHFFIEKCSKSLLQNALGFLLQNATVLTKCEVYCKMRLYIQ